MKQGFFRRIFILYGVILLLALLGAELYITGAVRQSHINTLRDNLAVQALLISRDIPFPSPAPLDQLCRRFKETTHARVTVIAMNGRVLGDSDHDSVGMDNHKDRLEIQQADLSGLGMTVRHSDTLGADLLYVARRIVSTEKPSGFIRLSVPLIDVDAAINALRIRILLAVSAILLATGFFSFWQIEHLRRLTVQIRDFSTALAKGELGKRLFISHAGEFDEIAESLNSMSVELKQSIASTEEERNRLAVILSSIPDALLISDARGAIRITSAASRKFFGDTAFQGKQFIEVVRNSEFIKLLDDVRREHQPGSAEFTLEHPEERHCVARVSPLSYAAGEVSGYVAIFHDITQLKKLEQVRKDFVANISHEIKTPITAIQGFAETLLDGALDDKKNAQSFLETMLSNSRRVNSLVDDLLTISKIELGVITVAKTLVALEDVADPVLAMLMSKATEKNIALTTVIPSDLGAIMADRDRLIQILTNLVDNAIKFTPEGGSVRIAAQRVDCSKYKTHGPKEVNLGLRALSPEPGGDCVEIAVEDTGIGIAEKHLSRLGERFYRVDTARSRNMGGTGLGLAIVKHLVKAQGWDMRIESTLGKGTAVRIILST